ncbi:hypothetical protein THRCLA_08378 [Thraustotheca clavata]|uniref:Guanine nucleotide-binding protein-like 1 n=1 Tax=Thraustotheca clavata TaxID=74557 RepID=A0A1V9Z6S5_9STRA|nr:hypothetical protein THRCLA_08378 [Thraustotheca clavata]
MTRSKPFSGKQKKLQLQAKREKHRQGPKEEKITPDKEGVEDAGFSGDLRTIFAKEPQWIIDERKRDATRALVLASDRANSQEIYKYGLSDGQNQPPIPLRPEWTKEMTPEELEKLEETSFTTWLQMLQEQCTVKAQDNILINFYERNLQVWRQLWRVIEKSNVILHFADSRCPLLHLSHRLIETIHQHHPSKRVLIVLTKVDFIPIDRVHAWIEYLQARYDVPVIPYSRERALECNPELLQVIGASSSQTNFMKARSEELNEGTLTIGLVGEPNVGKSSFLNSIFLKKLVSVSATPGHTKHFQTHYYDHPEHFQQEMIEKACFCDCPGVVFPRFNVPTALQILFGSYPIAQTREPYSAIRFIAENCVPSLHEIYKLKKIDEDDEWSPYTLSESYAAQRGFHVKGGKLDVFRAANLLLRDTLNGTKVILSFPPPEQDTRSNDSN